jgi:TRAP-type uncharacterized transport system substrate-binding protein
MWDRNDRRRILYFGVGIGTLVMQQDQPAISVEATKASVENMRLLDSGDTQPALQAFGPA